MKTREILHSHVIILVFDKSTWAYLFKIFLQIMGEITYTNISYKNDFVE